MKYLVIGAVAGGASTAARLRRLDEHAEIIVFEKGAYVSYANCGLPYYIGDVIKDRNALFVQTPVSFRSRFNIDTRVLNEVVAIDAANKTVTARDLQTGNTYTESYDKLVLSPGAEPVRPPLSGIDLPGIFTLRNVADTDRIKTHITQQRPRKAVVIGAGFIGLEMAENLHLQGVAVTVIEMGRQALAPMDYPMAAILQQHMRGHGVDLRLSQAVTGFEQNGDGLRVLLRSGDTVDADMVILSIGVRPDTRLAMQAGLATGKSGGILVNRYLQTSDPGIYAVGDAIEFANPITGQSMPTYLAGPANKQGRIVANNIVLGNRHEYKGAINTAIVKVFDMTAGAAGVAAKHLEAAGIPHSVSTTHSGAHAGYYPGSRQMTIQITFSPQDGRLLGAQVAGYEGVDKRLDMLSGVIQRGGSVYDLMEYEHAYAPPYSSAKDPVNMAGFVADNLLSGKLNIIYWNELEAQGDIMLVDVRNPDEYEAGHIAGAVNIPLDQVRTRLHELPADTKLVIYCEAGLRGYLAQRILLQSGYSRVVNLSGGYRLWKDCQAEDSLLATPATIN